MKKSKTIVRRARGSKRLSQIRPKPKPIRKAVLMFFLMAPLANAAYLDFSGMYQSELPAVGDGFTISQVGSGPDAVTFEGPQIHDTQGLIPAPTKYDMALAHYTTDELFVSVDPCQFLDNDGNCVPTAESSNYGYRLDFDEEVDLTSISILNKADTDLMRFSSDGTWQIMANASDFVEVSPGVIETTNGLRTEQGSIGVPIAALALDGATWMEWSLIGFGATQIPQYVSVGNIHVVSEPSALLMLAMLGLGLFVWRS